MYVSMLNYYKVCFKSQFSFGINTLQNHYKKSFQNQSLAVRLPRRLWRGPFPRCLPPVLSPDAVRRHGSGWLLFRQLDTSYSPLGGGRLNLEDASRRLGAKQTSLRGIFSISDPQGKKAQPIVGGAAPLLVLLGSRRKQA